MRLLPLSALPLPAAIQNVMVDISVVIVNWNAGAFLPACLASVAAHMGGLCWEALIVDNASTDDSREIIRTLPGPVTLIANETNRGFAAANNQALAQARGRYALLLNGDTEVRGGSIATLVAAADADATIGIVGGQLFTPTGEPQRWAKGSKLSLRSAINHYLFLSDLLRLPGLTDPALTVVPRPVGWVSGCCLLLRRAMLDQIGPLDESFFMYAEDMEYCHRAWAHGWRVIHHPGLSITHFQGQSLAQQPVMAINEMPLRMIDRYFARVAPRWQLLPFRFVTFVGLALRALLRGLHYLRRRNRITAASWRASLGYARLATRLLALLWDERERGEQPGFGRP